MEFLFYLGLTCNDENIALDGRGARCQASSALDSSQTCEKAIDGSVDVGGGHHWGSNNEGVGSWLKVIFDQIYMYVFIISFSTGQQHLISFLSDMVVCY